MKGGSKDPFSPLFTGTITAKIGGSIKAIIDTRHLERDTGPTMFATLYNTGARVSEITGMKVMDLSLGTPSVRIHGKGRKDHVMPLWQSTAKLLKKCLISNDPENPLFPSARGKSMTRHGVEYRLRIAKKAAEAQRAPP